MSQESGAESEESRQVSGADAAAVDANVKMETD